MVYRRIAGIRKRKLLAVGAGFHAGPDMENYALASQGGHGSPPLRKIPADKIHFILPAYDFAVQPGGQQGFQDFLISGSGRITHFG